MTIKVLLILGLVMAGMFALRGGTTATTLAIRRLTSGAAVLLGALAVAFPDAVTWAANLVGVGRGTDLVLYVFVVVSLFVWIGMYRRIADLEARFVKLARHVALEAPRHLEGGQTGQQTATTPDSDHPAVPMIAEH